MVMRKTRSRSIWPYRDWGCECHLSFDQFTIEQLAGDLLPCDLGPKKTTLHFIAIRC